LPNEELRNMSSHRKVKISNHRWKDNIKVECKEVGWEVFD